MYKPEWGPQQCGLPMVVTNDVSLQGRATGSLMSTRKLMGAASAVALTAGLTLAGATGLAAAAPRPSVTLARSTAPFTTHTRVIGNVAGSQKLTIQVWLRTRGAAAQNYATAVSTPGNRLYHKYLSPNAYAARFGASSKSARAVEKWLRGQGFSNVHTSGQRAYVRATGTVSAIDSALHTTLKLYSSTKSVNAGRYQLRANSTALKVPAALASSVLAVTGLDNAAPKVPLERPTAPRQSVKAGAAPAPRFPCSGYYGEHVIGHLPKRSGRTSFPTEVCGYNAQQLRAAYGANPKNTGKGQTIALVELGLTPEMFLTLQDYARHNHIPAPSTERYAELSLGSNACGDPFDIEEQIDVESSYDMAPGAHQLVVGGDGCNFGDFGLQGLFDADIAVLGGNGKHPLATIASNSWESGDEGQPGFLDNIENSYLVRAVTEGVGMYFSAGDGSGVEMPSSDPSAIAVGGTTLGIGKHHKRLFETGWSTSLSFDLSKKWVLEGEQGASGGGPSVLWKQPRFQKGKVPNALAKAPGNRGGRVRSAPDVSADADPYTGMAVGLLNITTKSTTYIQEDFGGTSLASPLVAGMVAAAQQGQRSAFGNIDPILYKLLGTRALNDTLPVTKHTPGLFRGTVCDQFTCGIELLTAFDVQSFSMEGYTGQVTRRGYDNMTGVGTPRGQRFIAALRRLG
jgi:subtilase family serine protease